ncbi:MAG: DUF4405 domain-containing protein [Propionibacteriaceae bacterium]|jgi:hypothetical protein|nr:DUF4405 domain-containing protein [Propionibacteriaceae bacterium]
MGKNVFKIVLDLILLVTATLLYHSQVLGLAFHEIAGLCIAGVIVIHLAFGWKSLVGTTKRLFAKGTPWRMRVRWIVGACLLVSFALIVVSGLFISEIVLPSSGGGRGGSWRVIHDFCAGLTIIFAGVHIGLHWDFVRGVGSKVLKIPANIARPLSYGLLAIVLAFGAFSLVTSNLASLLMTPFNGTGGGMRIVTSGGQPGNFPSDFPTDGTFPTDGAFPTDGTMPQRGGGRGSLPEGEGPSFNQEGEGPTFNQESDSQAGGMQVYPSDFPTDFQSGEGGQIRIAGGGGGGRFRSGGSGTGFVGALGDFATYTSMMALFAAVSYLIARRGKDEIVAPAPVPEETIDPTE